MPALKDWYQVRFDDGYIYRNVEPPDGEAWSDQIAWQRVRRVCIYAADLYSSDEIYIFTDERPESYVIPTEASGGLELFHELIGRHLFDPEMAIRVASATNELFCYPPMEKA
jgi:hypothetical protein